MTYIPFKTNTAKQKPNTLINQQHKCPFCDRETLVKEQNSLKQTKDFLIVENKFPVMEGSFATVLIEHLSCDEHIGTYSVEYLTELLNFAIDYCKELESTAKYQSVAFFKNHGIFSGGSIKHPHMQIVGFESLDYKVDINPNNFVGASVIENDLVDWNVSSFPRAEGYEFNIIIKDTKRIDVLAFLIQKTVQFILESLNTKYQCYNLAFFFEDDSITVKVISRGPTSVLLLGFEIHQTPDNLEEVAHRLKEYASKSNHTLAGEFLG
ncbi:DUF4931 domain-containing protein [Priestia filamentosa]|uniref:DUF4931 domain-containing protein n=1 Tax=Priestia filamentosa TaxID=1402861 RepID=UPI003981A89B